MPGTGGIDGKDGLASCPPEAQVLVAGKGVSGKLADSELRRFLVVLEETRAGEREAWAGGGGYLFEAGCTERISL